MTYLVLQESTNPESSSSISDLVKIFPSLGDDFSWFDVKSPFLFAAVDRTGSADAELRELRYMIHENPSMGDRTFGLLFSLSKLANT